jgi:hypothetical protein
MRVALSMNRRSKSHTQGVFGQESVNPLARTADRAAKPAAFALKSTTHFPLDPVAPRSQRLLTVRATETSYAQPRLDNGRVSPYDDRSGARFPLCQADVRHLQ